MMRLLLAAAAAAALVPAGRAADIVNYSLDPARYDRFASGFPAAPVASTAGQYLGAGLDLSGVGWLAANPRTGVTLIAPQYILGSAHNGFGVDSVVRFAAAGGVQSFTVEAVTRLNSVGLPGNPPSDLIVGRLSASTAGTGVAPIAVAQVAPENAAGLSLLVYGSNPTPPYSSSPHLALGTVSRPLTGAAADFPGTNNYLYEFPRDPAVDGSSQFVPGDSGSPSLVRHDGQALILGTHYAIGQSAGVDYSYDVFLSNYTTQLREATDFTVLIFPVPEPAGLLAAAVAGLVVWRRRSRSLSTATAR